MTEFYMGLTMFVGGLAIAWVFSLKNVRIFFLRRTHESVIRKVEAEMQAEFGVDYMPDPSQRDRLWRQLLAIHGLDK